MEVYYKSMPILSAQRVFFSTQNQKGITPVQVIVAFFHWLCYSEYTLVLLIKHSSINPVIQVVILSDPPVPPDINADHAFCIFSTNNAIC